jgi:hypothetical protein
MLRGDSVGFACLLQLSLKAEYVSKPDADGPLQCPVGGLYCPRIRFDVCGLSLSQVLLKQLTFSPKQVGARLVSGTSQSPSSAAQDVVGPRLLTPNRDSSQGQVGAGAKALVFATQQPPQAALCVVVESKIGLHIDQAQRQAGEALCLSEAACALDGLDQEVAEFDPSALGQQDASEGQDGRLVEGSTLRGTNVADPLLQEAVKLLLPATVPEREETLQHTEAIR